MSAKAPNTLAQTIRGFFLEHLPLERGLTANTSKSYRDALVLFLRFLANRRKRPLVELDLDDFDRGNVLEFLDHLQACRGNAVSSRNARLAALRSFAHYAAARAPEHLPALQQVIAIPRKRAPSSVVEYLEGEEFGAMLDLSRMAGPTSRRDYALHLTLFNTGARVQELLDIRPFDLHLDRPLEVRLFGKGRKERICPIWPQTAEALRGLLVETGLDADAKTPLFRNRRGEPLTRFGVRYILRKYARIATPQAPSLARKCVHPHVLRHTAAVHLLQAGVDIVTISHWLGHRSIETTNHYTTIDLEAKRAAVARATVSDRSDGKVAAWKSDASILDWLEAL